MIIQNLNKCYEVIQRMSSASRISEFFCLEQQSQEAFLLVRIADSTLAKRFTLFLEEKVRGTEFPDYKECFQADGAFYAAFTYSSDRTLADKIGMENCTREERAEIARRLLEQLLLRSPHPYFMRNALRPDRITVADSLDVAWNYHLDEVRTFDYCTMEIVCQRLGEVMIYLFEKEMQGKQYPSLENYLLELKEGRLSDYLELYREFMPVYEILCANEPERLWKPYLERLLERCRKIVDKPNTLKGYLRLGKRYVAKKIAFVFMLAAVLLPLPLLWIAYPWVQSRFLTKTMVFHSEDTEGYTGKVRLVSDLETENVIFLGTLTDGRINGRGKLFDPEGNLRYQGEFLEDQYSGMGESYYRNGNVEYAGQFEADQYEGTGKLFSEEGTLIYEGDFSQGLYEGSGTLYYADGDIWYSGGFSQGLYDGIGILYYADGGIRYSGDFSQGLYDGIGTLYYADGGIQYSGDFSQGLYDGAGVLFYENGVTSYEGDFLQGKRSGSGKVYEENGELLYDGTLSQDRYEGEGILYRKGEIVSQGSFHTGILISGTVVYYDRKGNLLYQGDIHNGLYTGQGKLYSDGILLYEGGFAEGKYHGSGKKYAFGTGMLLYDGMFDMGEYCGEGRLYHEDTGSLLYNGYFYRSLYDGKGKLYDPVCGYLIYDGDFRESRYEGQGILYDQTTGEVVFEGIFYNNEPRPVQDNSEQEEETSEDVTAVNPAE